MGYFGNPLTEYSPEMEAFEFEQEFEGGRGGVFFRRSWGIWRADRRRWWTLWRSRYGLVGRGYGSSRAPSAWW